MDTELPGSSSGGVVGDVYNFNRAEIVGDHHNSAISMDFQDCSTYNENNESFVFVPSSATTEQDVSVNCDNETLVGIKSLERVAEKKVQGETSDVYLSTGIYIHPFTFNGSYENIIELIDVDPNEKLQNSPLPNKEDYTANGLDIPNFEDNQHFAFGCQVPITNNIVPFLGNYANIPINNELQSLHLIYNTPSTSNASEPEYIDINHFIPKEMRKTVPPFLRRNRKSKTDVVLSKLKPKETQVIDADDDDDDEDVVFVKEWALPTKFSNSKQKLVASTENNSNETNAEGNTSTSSSLSTSMIRRRRRRRTFGEKRKNPVRKAQINKASLDLAEKLAIPPSVFNARVKGRKPKQPVIVETKNLRQSCRTSGAIFSPPRALTQCDIREWPVDGMHERPFYDETTDTIVKYHIPTNKVEKEKCAEKCDVLSELAPPQVVNKKPNKSESFPTVTTKKTFKSKKAKNLQHSNNFAKTALDCVQIMFEYVQELKEFNKLASTNASSNQENQPCEKKATLYEKSLEFRHYQNGMKECKKEKGFRKMMRGCEEENVQKMIIMLRDTCTLYSLASGVNDKDFINLITDFNNVERKNWIRAQI